MRNRFSHRLAVMLGLLTLFSLGLAHAETATRTSAFEYDPVSGLLTKEIIEPGNSDLCLVTVYTYDAYGNKLNATTRNCNGSAGSNPGVNSEAAAPAAGSASIIDPRTASTTYDAQGRFPITSTNALGQSESKVINGNFGVVTSLTGPNGLTTTWTYDSFGRKLTENRADGTGNQTAYALCDASCPANAKYTITNTQAGAPYSKTYYDMYNRAIQAETQDKDGAVVYSRTDYDHLGRTSRSSRPVKSGQALAWNTVTYDLMNRPLTTTAPDATTTNATYNGFITVTKNALNQSRIEQRNSQGQLVAVTDTQSKTLSYQYNAFGNLTQTTDALGNITTISYDLRGRKVAMNDPDQGSWSYVYDALGQLKSQTDAKSQTTTFVYDKLGRMTQRNEPDLVSTWTYDTCDATLNPGGKCIGKPVKESSDNGYVRTYVYDAYGRSTAELDNVDQGYGVAKTYDSYGRVDTLVYPTGFSVRNVYSTSGYLIEVHNASTNALYWRADTMDAEGHVIQQTYGNGVVTNRTYDPNTGRITQISDGPSGSVSNQSFVYDSIGNLTQRYDGATGLNESFGYDSLNRLTATTAQSGSITTSVTMSYNAIGNIMSKSDVGTYTYGTQPHAVASITMNDGVTNYATYTYDANGNMTSGKGRTLGWTSWNMPTSIANGTNTYGFVYNSAHERVKETSPTETIYNVSPRLDTGIHVEKHIKTSDGSITYVHSLYAGNMPFGSVTTTAAAVVTKTRYFHTDHLGSIVAITDEAGNVAERRSYDAWGKRRNIDGTPTTSILHNIEDRHGFTGQEELEDLGLVHMNGRLYDPTIGRFLSADPTIQIPDDMQNYNRYSYINNNPLSAVDYSGYGFFSFVRHIFSGIGHIISGVVKAAISVVKTAAVYYAGSAVCGPYCGAFAVGYYQTGSIKGGLIATATALAFDQVGNLSMPDDQGNPGLLSDPFAHAFAHGLVGGLSSVASGGNFQSGFMSGAFGEYFGSSNNYGLIIRMVIGGTASVLGGGKFENGAETAAFGYLLNAAAHSGNALVSDNSRLLTPNEIDAALSEFPTLKTDSITISYNQWGDAACTSSNGNIDFPQSMAFCSDFITCGNGNNAGWFIHEVTHVYQYQNGSDPFWGHIFSADVLTFGNYLSLKQYVKTPSPNNLSTEKQADWHMWHYNCTNGLQSGC